MIYVWNILKETNINLRQKAKKSSYTRIQTKQMILFKSTTWQTLGEKEKYKKRMEDNKHLAESRMLGDNFSLSINGFSVEIYLKGAKISIESIYFSMVLSNKCSVMFENK